MQRKRRFLLFGIAALITALLFGIGPNSYWFRSRVWGNFCDNLKRLDMPAEQRRLSTWEDSYSSSMKLKAQMQAQHVVNELLLMPPAAYLRSRWGHEFPEPIVLYYFTGIRSTLMNGADTGKAMVALVCTDKKLKLVPLSSSAVRSAIYQLYQPFLK